MWVRMVVMIMMMVVMMVMMAMMVMIRTVSIGVSADALDVMMMTGLRQADLILETQHLFAVLTQLAVHLIVAAQNIFDSLGESIQY